MFLPHSTWKQYIGDMTVLTAYNRTNMKMMFVMTAIFFVVAEALFRIMLYNTVAKVRTNATSVECVVVYDYFATCVCVCRFIILNTS
jgi:hypothetical protein